MAQTRALVVGAGSISECWFPPLIAEKVNVVGIVDINLQAAQNRAQEFNIPAETGTDLKAMVFAAIQSSKTNKRVKINL